MKEFFKARIKMTKKKEEIFGKILNMTYVKRLVILFTIPFLISIELVDSHPISLANIQNDLNPMVENVKPNIIKTKELNVGNIGNKTFFTNETILVNPKNMEGKNKVRINAHSNTTAEIPGYTRGDASKLYERKKKPRIPKVVVACYPKWAFLLGGTIRSAMYHYFHLYGALFLFWSIMKIGGRMDWLQRNPIMRVVDGIVRPLLNFSTKVLPFTGASGISAQIFTMFIGAAARYMRTSVWVIYDSEFDYIFRQHLKEGYSRSSILLSDENVQIELDDRPTLATIGPKIIKHDDSEMIHRVNPYLYYRKPNNEPDLLNRASKKIAELKGYYDQPEPFEGPERWGVFENLEPGEKYSLVDENTKRIAGDIVTKEILYSQNLLNWQAQFPWWPRIKGMEYPEFDEYFKRLTTQVIKYPAINQWWNVKGDMKSINWGGLDFEVDAFDQGIVPSNMTELIEFPHKI